MSVRNWVEVACPQRETYITPFSRFPQLIHDPMLLGPVSKKPPPIIKSMLCFLLWLIRLTTLRYEPPSTSQKLERQRCGDDSWGGWVLTLCLQLLQPHGEVLRLCCHQGPLAAPVINSLIMTNPIHSPTSKMLYLLPRANLQERRIHLAQAQVASIDNASKSQTHPFWQPLYFLA